MTILVNKKFDNVDDGIQNMLSAANHDYTKFLDNKEMHKEFVEGWVIKQGQKYIKILTRNGSSAWGFVVNTDNDKKFKKGDIIFWKGHVAVCINSKKLIHAYSPEKKVLIMPINYTIKRIEKTAHLTLKKLSNILN